VAGFRPAAERAGIALGAEVAPGVGEWALDPTQIQRVLVNLLGNALRHTPAGGAICVRVMPGDGGIVVEVADTGEGIAAQDVPHIFDRFYRGEPSRSRETGGTGLGLAISRAIVEAHGGRIQAERNEPRGARFVFDLPLRAANT
jgi:signal transduction histidine kinase